jgi:glutamate 5-kinase
MGETQRLQYELAAIVTRHLLAAGLPGMPVQASATAVLRGGTLEHLDPTAVALLVEQGMVPVLYGVPAVDREQGCAILSGDVIAPHVAHALGCDRLLHATDVDGIFTADPRTDPGAVRIPRVARVNADEVRARLGGSTAIDVTGGMATKLGELLAWAERGLVSRLIDARVPGRLAAALMDEPVGTLVDWGA